MLDICVTVLCGIPGSGKSTFAKSLIDKSLVASQGYWEESKSLHWLLVSYDEIIPTDVEKNIIEKEVLFFKKYINILSSFKSTGTYSVNHSNY